MAGGRGFLVGGWAIFLQDCPPTNGQVNGRGCDLVQNHLPSGRRMLDGRVRVEGVEGWEVVRRLRPWRRLIRPVDITNGEYSFYQVAPAMPVREARRGRVAARRE